MPSGLRLLLDEEPNAITAGVVSVIRGGSFDDPVGAEGLAHLVEHLTFRAVDPPTVSSDGPETRSDRLTRHGVADQNGMTTRDCLLFYEFAPARELPALLALEAARLTAPLAGVDDRAVTVERQVLGSEHLYREDPRMGAWATNILIGDVFPPGHPYARSPGGTNDSRRKLTLAQANAYSARVFRPERMTLLVAAPAGATSLAALSASLPAALRGDASHPVARAAPPSGAMAPTPAPSKPPPVKRLTSALPTPELWISWRLPGAIGAAGPLVRVLGQWLQRDAGTDQLIPEEPKIRSVRFQVHEGATDSVLLVRVLVAEGADPDRVAQVVTARVASAWSRERQDREVFADLNSLFETARLFDQPAQAGRALSQAMAAAMTEWPASMNAVWEAMQSVASASVAKLAYQYLAREQAHAVMFTPAPVAAGDLRGVGGPATAASTEDPARELISGAAAWDPVGLRGFQPPPLPMAVKKLDNGLTVVTVRRSNRTVVAWLVFGGGYADAEPPLLVELAVRARPDVYQAPRLHILPARGATHDMSFDSVEFVPAQLLEGLTLLFAKATARVKEWPTAEGLARVLAPLAADEDARLKKADQALLRALLGDHPYARVVTTTDLSKVTRSDVNAWLGRVQTTRNGALIVVGDVAAGEVERAAKILSDKIKSPQSLAAPAVPAPVALRAARGEHLVPVVTARPGTLTDVRLGCLLPPMGTDAGHYSLLNEAIEARLNAALRAEHGDTYGVVVHTEALRGGTTFLLASTVVGEDKLAHSLAVLRGQWRRWTDVGFDAGEINVARWRHAATLPFRQASGDALAFQLARQWNTGPDGLAGGEGQRNLFPDVAELSSARVNEIFATCKANAVLGLTGNESLIEGALEQSWPALSQRARRTNP